MSFCQYFKRGSFLLLFLLAAIQIDAFEGGIEYLASQRILSNDDIISLVKSDLSDKAIIALIQNSQTQFDLSPEALTKLRNAGVSNAVIEIMILSQSSEKKPSEAPRIPTAYGYYLSDGEALIKLDPRPVIAKIGLPLRAGKSGYAMDGLAGEPSIEVSNKSSILIVYQQNLDVNALCLSELVFVKTKKAYQFNILKTDQRFFSDVYTRDYYDTVEVNLWQPAREIPLSIEPVEGRRGMFRFMPQSALAYGNYAFYHKGEMHEDGTVFSSEPQREASAFYFGIRADVKPREIPVLTEEEIREKRLKLIPFLDRAATGTSMAYGKQQDRQFDSVSKYIKDALVALQAAHKIADEELKSVISKLSDRLEAATEIIRTSPVDAEKELWAIRTEIRTLVKELKRET